MTTGVSTDAGRIGRFGVPHLEPHPELEFAADAADLSFERNETRPNSISHECVRQHLLLTLPLAVVDLATLSAAFLVSCTLAGSVLGPEVTRQIPQMGALGAIAAFLYFSLGLYHNVSLQPIHEFRLLVTGSSLAVLVLAIANAALAQLSPTERWAFGLTALGMLMLGPAARSLARRVLGNFHWWLRPVLVVGSGPQGEQVCRSLLQRPWLGFRPVGFVDNVPGSRNVRDQSLPVLGSVHNLAEIAAQSKACWVMIAMARRSAADVQRVIDTCCDNVPNVVVASNMIGVPALWTRAQEFGDTAGIHFQGSHLLLTPHWVKRSMDLAVVACGAVLVLPLVLAIAAAIKLVSPEGPIFFSHRRVGRNGETIWTWKFRTMVPNGDQILEEYLRSNPDKRREWETLHKLKRDPRVIPYVGALLRKFSLDELPQLWNVLNGDMSLVGPRPIVTDEIGRYGGAFSLYKKVRPGITGLWQISGRNNTTYQERVDLDVYYVTNWSPWLDLYILVRTIRTVLLGEGAY